jgi:Uma2 family endonuclease
MAVTPQQLTLEEFLKLPEAEPALEYFDGVVTQKVSPKGRHAVLQGELARLLHQAGLKRKVVRVFPELRATFGGASCVPDIAVYRWQRVPTDATGRVADDFIEPPDIAVEIVSPGQSVNALVRRCLWYVANGVSVALLVDPDDESVLAYRPGPQTAAWSGPDRIDLSEILPGFQITVEQLFASLRQE